MTIQEIFICEVVYCVGWFYSCINNYVSYVSMGMIGDNRLLVDALRQPLSAKSTFSLFADAIEISHVLLNYEL